MSPVCPSGVGVRVFSPLRIPMCLSDMKCHCQTSVVSVAIATRGGPGPTAPPHEAPPPIHLRPEGHHPGGYRRRPRAAQVPRLGPISRTDGSIRRGSDGFFAHIRESGQMRHDGFCGPWELLFDPMPHRGSVLCGGGITNSTVTALMSAAMPFDQN